MRILFFYLQSKKAKQLGDGKTPPNLNFRPLQQWHNKRTKIISSFYICPQVVWRFSLSVEAGALRFTTRQYMTIQLNPFVLQKPKKKTNKSKPKTCSKSVVHLGAMFRTFDCSETALTFGLRCSLQWDLNLLSANHDFCISSVRRRWHEFAKLHQPTGRVLEHWQQIVFTG